MLSMFQIFSGIRCFIMRWLSSVYPASWLLWLYMVRWLPSL